MPYDTTPLQLQYSKKKCNFPNVKYLTQKNTTQKSGETMNTITRVDE